MNKNYLADDTYTNRTKKIDKLIDKKEEKKQIFSSLNGRIQQERNVKHFTLQQQSSSRLDLEKNEIGIGIGIGIELN